MPALGLHGERRSWEEVWELLDLAVAVLSPGSRLTQCHCQGSHGQVQLCSKPSFPCFLV